MPDQNMKNTAEECVDQAINQVGKHIVLALPLGLGKANHIANAFYDKALSDPSLSLHIITALTLELPSAPPGLGQRFLQPIIDRLYTDVPELAYAKARRLNQLPTNIKVTEFFLNPGKLLSSTTAQQNYISSNYTHAVRDLIDQGVNVLAQMIAPHPGDESLCSLSSNTDLTMDLLDAAAKSAKRIVLLGEINHQLPFMGNDALLGLSTFDAVLNGSGSLGNYPLFPVPNQPVSFTDYAIALHVSTLVKDGGTLQIGIGSLGDAIAHMIALRHQENALYKMLVERLASLQYRFPHIEQPENSVFDQGLYACSEMLVEGLLHLRDVGVLKRQVSDNNSPAKGIFCHAGFFLGSRKLYEKLRTLNETDSNGICMSRISFINDLYGDESLKRSQRKHARFVNSAMMVALTGEAVSDGLKDHQVVSGVGGQYNFVAQAQQLEDGRSIVCLPSTRTNKGKLHSNIVWEYAHTTIPRHLRDIVITEYGVADIRGKSDQQAITSLLAITDSRFQESLLAKAKAAGKVDSNYKMPGMYKNNYPEKITQIFATKELSQALPYFPLGTDFTQVEAVLAVVFDYLKTHSGKRQMFQLFITGLIYTSSKSGRQQKTYSSVLRRLDLLKRGKVNIWFYRMLVIGALRTVIKPERPMDADKVELR